MADPTRTVRDQFLVEIAERAACGDTQTGTPLDSLADLDSLFEAWVHQVYHQRVHSETDQTPLQRFLAHGAPAPTPGDLLAEAFRWSEWRTVTTTAQVNLHGNLYDVDPSLVGRRVELVFDPTNLDDIDVRVRSTSYGKAIPSRLRRHVHPKAAAGPVPEPVRTGIDYLRLIETRHKNALQARLQYAHLDPQPAPIPAATADQTPATPESGTPVRDDTGDDPGDEDAWDYETDLVALAATSPEDGSDDPGTAADQTPQAGLEAELAGFAALLTQHHDGGQDIDGDDIDGDAAGERAQAAS